MKVPLVAVGTLASEFFETRPQLLKDIQSLEKRRSLRLLPLLHKENDEVNFLSRISEIRFGLLFDSFCEVLRFDYMIDHKTPDWMVQLNGQSILCEVLRLNTPEEETREAIAYDRALRYYQKEHPGVPIITRGTVKTMSTDHLGGAESKLMRKVEKYAEIIDQHDLLFVICVAPKLETFLSEVDFSDFLMGRNGFFETNALFGEKVSGVLLHSYFGQHYYFHNKRARFQLTDKNRGSLNSNIQQLFES